MDQSMVIALTLFVAFIVFITMRGELAQYIQLIL